MSSLCLIDTIWLVLKGLIEASLSSKCQNENSDYFNGPLMYSDMCVFVIFWFSIGNYQQQKDPKIAGSINENTTNIDIYQTNGCSLQTNSCSVSPIGGLTLEYLPPKMSYNQLIFYETKHIINEKNFMKKKIQSVYILHIYNNIFSWILRIL